MSYGGYGTGGYGAPGYPPQQPGYPPQQPGYPPQQAGYPPQPGYGPTGGYPPAPAGGMPMPDYHAGQPAGGGPPLGFGGQVQMPGGPPQGNPYGAAPGYPMGASQPPAGYPPSQPAPGYPGAGAAYPPGQPGYGTQPGYAPAGAGYGAPPAGPGYGSQPPPQQQAAGYGPGAHTQPGHGAPAPQPGYGTGGHGAPPAAGYGAGGHGAPPAANYGTGGHGAPPAADYGTGGHAAPPTSAMAGMSLGSKPQVSGTVKPASGFRAEADAEVLRKAMKGMGTDESAIIGVLSRRSNKQRMEVKDRFKTMFGKDLIKDLKSELGGHFEDVVLAMMLPPDEFEASELHKAVSGIGTKESVLIEIMCSRSNAEILKLNDTYKRLYRSKLEECLSGDTSGHFKRLLISLSCGKREENTGVDHARAQADAKALYQAGEGQMGTDESRFNAVLASQSFEQLRVVFDEYKKLGKRSLDQAISSEFSGDIKDGLVAIVKCVTNTPAFFAERLYKSMKGAGTNDQELIRIVVSRCEVDMVQIKQQFQAMYGKTLESFIKDDVTGDYKSMLVALVL